jgi:hypothetical protein
MQVGKHKYSSQTKRKTGGIKRRCFFLNHGFQSSTTQSQKFWLIKDG